MLIKHGRKKRKSAEGSDSHTGVWKKLLVLMCVFSLATFCYAEFARKWKSIGNDSVHDPTSEAVGVLQEPESALSRLPVDTAGNLVDWVGALREGYINPRTNILPGTKIEVTDMDIMMGNTGEMPLVLFPHQAHTEWLDCSNCHDQIFVKKVDANPINMFAILSGEFCGRCHGAVSFPLTECDRCHSVKRAYFKGKFGVQPN